ncbi:MAG: hypothetical protein R3C60_12780 [Parvularculaceae bacterium]
MSANPQFDEASPLPWRAELALAARRFNAWWEGYAFDPKSERAALVEEIQSETLGLRSPEIDVAMSIWGEGRLDPGDPAWTMRHARSLGAPLKSDVVILGAAAGAPMRDLKNGTRWKLSGYSRLNEKVKGLDLLPYEAALSRINRASADAGLCFFELHRDADPAMIALFAAELVKPNAPFAFADFAAARKGARLRSCFAEPWGGSVKHADQLGELIENSGFRVVDIVDETRAFLPLVSRGWSRWRSAYMRAKQFRDPRQRAHYAATLSRYAHLWAERFDAIKAGQLQVVRIQARKRG